LLNIHRVFFERHRKYIECSRIDPQKNLTMKFAVVFALLAFASAASGQKAQIPCCYPLDQPSGAPIPPSIKIDCEKCRVEAKILQALTGKAAHVPTCRAKSNTFAPKQCFDGFCWCSTPYGIEIPNTKTKKKGLICKKKAKKGHNCLAKAATKGFKPKCNGKNYQKLQCLANGYCWCSMKDGFLIPNTVFNSKLKKAAPNCGRHRGLKFECGKRTGFLKHPWDKSRYIQCGAGGKTYSCICPGNTEFDVKEGICKFQS